MLKRMCCLSEIQIWPDSPSFISQTCFWPEAYQKKPLEFLQSLHRIRSGQLTRQLGSESHHGDKTGHPTVYTGATPYLAKSSSHQWKYVGNRQTSTQQQYGSKQRLRAIALKAFISTESTPVGSKFDSERRITTEAKDGHRLDEEGTLSNGWRQHQNPDFLFLMCQLQTHRSSTQGSYSKTCSPLSSKGAHEMLSSAQC